MWKVIPVVWLLDQVSKRKAEEHLSRLKKEYIYKDKVTLRLVYNKGAFLGLFKNRPLLLHVVSLIVMLLILIMGLPYWVGEKDRLMGLGLALIFGGAAGNYTDRLTKGQVVDFIAFAPNHKVHYNLADFAIFIGGGLLVIHELLGG